MFYILLASYPELGSERQATSRTAFSRLENTIWDDGEFISNRLSTARFHRFVCQRFDIVSNAPERGFETSKIPLVSKRS